MKFLFDIENPSVGTAELKSVLGFIDADFYILDMKSEIIDATTELIKIIGQSTYEWMCEVYEEGEEDADDKDWFLITRAQSAIGLDAFRKFAPMSDVSVTNQGRQMRIDEHHKPAFEWMLDRHDEQMERSYYKKLDYLIEDLDSVNPLVDATENKKWKDTEAYQKSFDILFRTTDEFGEFFQIESRYLLSKLAPGIKQIKQTEIKSRMGNLYQEYNDKKFADDSLDANIIHEVKAACAYLALSWAFKRMSATLFPAGVMQQVYGLYGTTQTKQAPDKNQTASIATSFEQDGQNALARLENLIAKMNHTPDPTKKPWEVDINPDDKFISL